MKLREIEKSIIRRPGLFRMTKAISASAVFLGVLGAAARVDSSSSLPGIEGHTSKAPLFRSKILSIKDKESTREGNFRFSDFSASESEEEPSSSSSKASGTFWERYKKWRHKTKTPNRSQAYSTSDPESGYDTEGQDTESPRSLNEVTFDLSEEEVKSPMMAPLKKEPEMPAEIPVASKRLSKKREELISPLTLKTLDRGDAERALKKILEQKADDYEAKGENFTRDLKEFEGIVNQFILENPVLSFMTEEYRQGFIKVHARSKSGGSPLKPTRSTRFS